MMLCPSRYNAYVALNVRQIASADFPTRWGKFRIFGFRGEFGTGKQRHEEEAVALVMGDIHASAEYRRAMVDVYARRALAKALERAGG